MVRWLARITVLSSIALGFSASCNVEDDGFRFDPEAPRGEGGDDGNATGGAPAAGGEAASGGESGAAAEAFGGADGDIGEAAGGAGGDSDESTGGKPEEAPNGGAGGEPVAPSGGRDIGSAGSAGTPGVDRDCSSGGHCAPDVPAGWSGPLAIYEGSEDDLPECPNGPELFDAGVRAAQDPLGCAPCICGGVNGGSCSLSVRTYNDEGCTIETSSDEFTTSCQVPITSSAFRFEGFELSGGSCNPSGGNLTERPEPRFQSVARGCALEPVDAPGCERGSACIPEPTLPFRDEICVFRVGDHDCPDDYPESRTYYTGLSDDRTCSSCGCRAPTECSGTLLAYNSQACTIDPPDFSSQPIALGTMGACRRFEDFSVLALELTDVEYPGGCEPIAPVSTQGSVTAEGPITVCCL